MSGKKHEKTRYNDEELAFFDKLIDDKLSGARSQLEFYLEQLQEMANDSDNKVKGLDDGISTPQHNNASVGY